MPQGYNVTYEVAEWLAFGQSSVYSEPARSTWLRWYRTEYLPQALTANSAVVEYYRPYVELARENMKRSINRMNGPWLSKDWSSLG